MTQTRCALPQGHHLTRPTLNPIIPDRFPVPREPHLTGTEAIPVFTCHSDGSQIPELSSHHISTCPAIKSLASLCHQSLQETLFSKVHSTSYRFCLRSSQGTYVSQVFVCVCVSVPVLCVYMCDYIFAFVHVCVC